MIRKYLKFTLSRAIGTVVDTVVLWLLSHFVFGGGYWATYVISPLISFEVAVMSNFLCSYFWIWRSRVTDHTKRSFWRHFVGFNLSSVAGFVVKMLFLLLFEKMFGWSVVVCNLAALCISGVLNYFLTDSLVFRAKRPRPEHEVLSLEEIERLTPLFRGTFGRLLARSVMWLCGIGRLNRLYDHIYHLRGPEAAREALGTIGCDYLVGNPERLDNLPKGAFITISNHPYGAIDGVILLDMIGHRRADLKIMVNQILGRVEPMRESFITVTPTTTVKKAADATTLHGIKSCLRHLREGHPMGFFPSGAVSDLHLPSLKIADRQWQESLLRLIGSAGVPVVPIHFEGRNSLFYYSLGLIDWRIRLLRLPREVVNKHRGRHKVVIGPTIAPSEIASAVAGGTLGELLRKAVYTLPSPASYTPASRLATGEESGLGVVSDDSTTL